MRSVKNLSLYEDEEVIFVVSLSKVVAAYLTKTGVLNLSSNNGLVKAVIGAIAIAVDDAEAGAGFERRVKT